MNNPQYELLFKPHKIGNMPLKNRILLAPMGCDYTEENGYIGQRYVDYYEVRAKAWRKRETEGVK